MVAWSMPNYTEKVPNENFIALVYTKLSDRHNILAHFYLCLPEFRCHISGYSDSF